MSSCDLVEAGGIRVIGRDQGAQLVEVPDHRSRRVQVELPARHAAHSEAMPEAGRDEDERPNRAENLALVEEDPVLARQNVERLGGIVMDMHRWAEAGRLRRLEQ